jgi:hypothetical protein
VGSSLGSACWRRLGLLQPGGVSCGRGCRLLVVVGHVLREGAIGGVGAFIFAHLVVLFLGSAVQPLIIKSGFIGSICCAIGSAAGRHRGPVGAGQGQQPKGSQQRGKRGSVRTWREVGADGQAGREDKEAGKEDIIKI